MCILSCVAGKIGNVFADKTGYNQVADANNIIIIYPQATSSVLSNPNGILILKNLHYIILSLIKVAGIGGAILMLTTLINQVPKCLQLKT